jgi:hypothetical protein
MQALITLLYACVGSRMHGAHISIESCSGEHVYHSNALARGATAADASVRSTRETLSILQCERAAVAIAGY